jgi:hypothetical protein
MFVTTPKMNPRRPGTADVYGVQSGVQIERH